MLSLAEAAAFIRENWPLLSVREEKDLLSLGVDPEHEAVNLSIRDEEWVVATAEWHGHEKELEDALTLAALILSGLARTAQEFREDKLAGTWLEVWDGEAYELDHHAIYLSIFDPEDWVLRSGERWKVERVHRRLLDHKLLANVAADIPVEGWPGLGSTDRFVVLSEEPVGPPPEWALNLLNESLGEPEPGPAGQPTTTQRLCLWRRLAGGEYTRKCPKRRRGCRLPQSGPVKPCE